MKKLVFIKTDYQEYDCFEVIEEDLLNDLRYLLSKCYYNGEIVLEVAFTDITNISLTNYDFFSYKLENLCLGKDDSDFEKPSKVKKALSNLGNYYDITPYWDFRELIL